MSKQFIFNPQYQIDVFVDWLGYDFNEPNYSVTDNLDLALSQEIKIAAVPYEFNEFPAYKQQPFDYTQFDLLLISDVEYNSVEPVMAWIEKLGIKNYLFALGAPFSDAPVEWVYRPWWAFNIVTKNQEHRDIVAADPLYEFDVLLGARRPHRDFVMAKMQTSTLLERSIINYRDVFNLFGGYRIKYFDDATRLEIYKTLNGKPLLYPYVSPNLIQEWEVTDNITNSVSDQVPWEIYAHTKYSVICETKHRELFLTEKIGKALFAKRLFVVFSCSNYLDSLKSLGFKTFSDILDESYDAIEDDVARFDAAFKQLEWLADQDYNQIMEKAKPILDYNHQHLLNYRQEIKDLMQQKVYNKIKEIKKC